MICKDCIHSEICFEWRPIIDFVVAQNECSDFLSKTKVMHALACDNISDDINSENDYVKCNNCGTQFPEDYGNCCPNCDAK